jgi:hypothetical protein
MFGIHSQPAVASDRESLASGLDTSAALVRAEADHLDATLHALVTRLGSVPGLKLSVSYRRGRLRRFLGDLPYINDLNRRSGPIQRITVRTNGLTYWLHRDGNVFRCGRGPTIPQAAPADQELTFSEWAPALFEQIAQQNLINHDSLVALRQLVEHDRVA